MKSHKFLRQARRAFERHGFFQLSRRRLRLRYRPKQRPEFRALPQRRDDKGSARQIRAVGQAIIICARKRQRQQHARASMRMQVRFGFRGGGHRRYNSAHDSIWSRQMSRAGEDLRAVWLTALAHERRASAHTLRAYGDDVARFLEFLREHLGAEPNARMLGGIAPADIRAFITQRRAGGLGARGVQRALAAIRSFFRYLAHEEIVENPAPRSIRTPRVPKSLPRPLSENDAARALAVAGENDVEWLAARDVALLTLLYGAGLRISEALSLKRGDVPLGRVALDCRQGPQGTRRARAADACREGRCRLCAKIASSSARRRSPLFLSRARQSR